MKIPHLDHVSLVGDRAYFENLGFRVAPTLDSGQHGRIFLDRTYLEVTPWEDGRRGLGARGWFLRPSDPFKAAEAIRASGLKVKGPSQYEGDDGRWLDVLISAASPAALPIITKRSDRPEEWWPPALADPHPNGASRISTLRLRLRSPGSLLRVLESLGVPRSSPTTFRLAGGVSVVVEHSPDRPEGIVAIAIDRSNGESLALTLSPFAR
jgi:hypothetical protein